jgi:hypothetical protein
MRLAFGVAFAALMLSGCIAEWKNPNGPQRWSGNSGPYYDVGNSPAVSPTSHSGSNGPQP